MKTIKLFFVFALTVLATTVSNAQNKDDYYVGKWELLTPDVPGGNGKSVMEITKVDGKLTGTMLTPEGGKVTFSRIDAKDKSITVYFKSSGYDVYIYLEKVDENHMTGSTMDMFDTTATRIVEPKSDDTSQTK